MKYLSPNVSKLLTFSVISIFTLWFFLIFSIPPFRYIMGGQDQGTYLNIAHQYNRLHSLNYKDYFRDSLDTQQRVLYDTHINYLMPSIELTHSENSTFSMKFYPMHPFMISIFEYLFGQDRAPYSLTFFSTIVILVMSLIAYELSNKKYTSFFVTALIILFNPLYLFFSKFPVGEITAVAFTSLGFYFLIKYINWAKDTKPRILYLVTSLLSFTCFFYTRMSSFMYIPMFIIFAWISVLYIHEQKKRTYLLIYFASLIISFGFSYIFYYVFQPELFFLVYGATIQSIIPFHSDTIIFLILLLSFLIIFIVYKNKNITQLDKLRNITPFVINVSVFLLALLSLYNTYLSLSSIDLRSFLPDTDFNRYWYLGNNIIQKLKYLNLYVIMQYLTPVGLLLSFTSGVYYLKHFKQNVLKNCLFVFIMWFLFINVGFGGLMRYPYYNTRYLFSESVIYMLLLVGIFLGELIQNQKTKILGIICLILILACSIPFTLFQLNGPEGPHMDFYNNITSIVNKNDLILTSTGHLPELPQKYFDNFTTWTIAPLKFYYDLNIFILPTFEDAYSQPIKDLSSRYKNTYLISDKEMPELGPNLLTTRPTYSYYNVSETCSLHTYSFLPLESVITMKIPKFLECLTPPNNYYTRYSNLYLYNITTSLK